MALAVEGKVVMTRSGYDPMAVAVAVEVEVEVVNEEIGMVDMDSHGLSNRADNIHMVVD